MWRELALVLSLLPFARAAVTAAPTLTSAVLSPSETALLDISEGFAGSFLEFSVSHNSSAQVTVRPNADIRELLRTASDGLRLGPTLETTEGLLFSLIGLSHFEVWTVRSADAHLTWSVSTEEEVGGLALSQESGKRFVVYWTRGESRWAVFYAELVGATLAPTRLDDFEPPVTATLHGCAEGLGLVLTQRTASETLASAYKLIQNSAVPAYNLTFPRDTVLDQLCYRANYVLTADRLYRDSELHVSLRPLLTTTGLCTAILDADADGNVKIAADQGVLLVTKTLDVFFMPRAQYCVSVRKGVKYFACVIDEPDHALFSLYYRTPQGWANSVARFPSVFPGERTAELRSAAVAGRSDGSIVAVRFASGIVFYSVFTSKATLLEVSAVHSQVQIEVCATNHFNRSDAACATAAVTPLEAADDSLWEFDCPVHHEEQRCEFPLAARSSGPNPTFTVDGPQETVSIVPLLSAKQTQYFLAESHWDVHCVQRTFGQSVAVSLDGSRVFLINLSDESIQLSRSSEQVTFLSCLPLPHCILVYGEYRNSTKTVFSASPGAAPMVEIPALPDTPKLLKRDSDPYVLTRHRVYYCKGQQWSYLEFADEVRDVTFARDSLIVLLKGTVEEYWKVGEDYAFYCSRKISGDVLSIAYSTDRLMAYTLTGRVEIYEYPVWRNLTLLSSTQVDCEFLSLQSMRSFALLRCRDHLQLLSPTERSALASAHFFPDPETRRVLAEFATGFLALSCAAGTCNETVWTIAPSRSWNLVVEASATALLGSQSLNISGEVTVHSDSTVTISYTVRLRNVGSFVGVSPTWNTSVVILSKEKALNVPIWDMFVGSDLQVSIALNPKVREVQVTPSCEVSHSIPLSCSALENSVLVPSLDLLLCYDLRMLSVAHYTCPTRNCTIDSTFEHPASAFHLRNIQQLEVLFHSVHTVALLVLGDSYGQEKRGALQRLIATIEVVDNRVRVIHSQDADALTNRLFVVAENTEKFHYFTYGRVFQHFLIKKIRGNEFEVVEKYYQDFSALSILSISSHTEGTKTMVSMLTGDKNLLLFTLSESLKLQSSVVLSTLQLAPSDLVYLQDYRLVRVSKSVLTVFAVPALTPLRETVLPHSVGRGDSYTPLAISTMAQSPATFAVNELGTRTYILNLAAPPLSEIACILPYNYFTFAGSSGYATTSSSMLIVDISPPELRIEQCEGECEGTASTVTISAGNTNSEPVSVSLRIERRGSSDWTVWKAVCVLLAVGVAATVYWRGRSERLRGYSAVGEVEMEGHRRGVLP